MKHLLLGAALTGWILLPLPALAWDGFDADSADLVEVTPDRVPSRGETVDMRSYDSDTTETCLVEAVSRNPRTVELVVRNPQGKTRTLVMEGR